MLVQVTLGRQATCALCVLQDDWGRMKAAILLRWREYARASKVLNTAGTLQLWQQSSLALIALSALTGSTHQLWKCLCWRAWKQYTLRRIQFSVLLGMQRASSDMLCVHKMFAAWLAVCALSQETKGATATAGAPQSPRNGGPVALPVLHMAKLPVLWREPIRKAEIMLPCDADSAIAPELLARKV